LNKIPPKEPKAPKAPDHLDLIREGGVQGFNLRKVENRPDDSPKLWPLVESENQTKQAGIIKGVGGMVFARKEDSGDDDDNKDSEDWTGLKSQASQNTQTPQEIAKEVAAKNAAIAAEAQKAAQAQITAQQEAIMAKTRKEALERDQAATATEKPQPAPTPAPTPAQQKAAADTLPPGVPPPPPPPPPTPPVATGKLDHLDLIKKGVQLKKVTAENDPRKPVEKADDDITAGVTNRRPAMAHDDSDGESVENSSNTEW
jgi:hypothetical protein